MIMINLRLYQIKLIDDIREKFRVGISRLILQLATGGGKTVIFTHIVKTASERGKRCLILTDRVELLEQAGGTFNRVGLMYENITASTKSVPVSMVAVAMVETLKRRVKQRLDFTIYLKHVDLLIIDEAHKAAFDPIFAFLKPECYVIGATATPIRQNAKKPLSDYFNDIVEGPSISELIRDGYLSKPKYFGVNVDLSTVKMKAGEFDEKDQERVFSEVRVFEGLKENLEKHAKGLKTMIFCPSVASSQQVARDLNCLHVDGNMHPAERDRILTEFENTLGSILTNCAITTTGYDHPGIECIVLYRATTSLPLYLQMIGRGSRVTETKKTFIILDFGMNVQRFGYWHNDRVWSLKPPKKKNRNKDDVFPVKFCPSCRAIVSVNVKTCEHCGFVWEVTEKERVFAELQELSYSEIQKRMGEAGSVEEMENIRVAKGYKVGYLLHKFTAPEQFYEYAKIKKYKNGWAKIQIENYLKKPIFFTHLSEYENISGKDVDDI
jgi:superfamily II DNA or RNA helicase